MPGLDFCTHCGSVLNVSSGASAVERQERRAVTVLFVDLVGFTGMTERLDPEDLRQLQMAYFTTASSIIRHYGGLVEKYIGDAVMAVFGVPVATEHDAYRAVLAGLDLLRTLDQRPLAGRYQSRARVGVATGEALVDLAAVHQDGQALLSGEVVATAARLQQRAPAGGVLVSRATRRATYGSISYDDDPQRLTLAGKAEPVQAWLARAPARFDTGVDEAEEVTPLVGRAHELDVLTSALKSCVQEGEARLVSVVGVHGVGKSRLVREFARRIRAFPELGLRWRVGRCLPYGESGSYGALAEIFKAEASVLDTDDPDTTRRRLADLLSEVLPDREVDRLTELLGPLAGLPGRPVNPGEAQAAWRQALLALAEARPTVLVLEDIHFADAVLLRFLAELVGAAANVPLFVLCTHRPELLAEQPAWAASLPGTFAVSLGPLRGGKLHTLIETVLDKHGLSEALGDRLAAISAGNPMYVLEYVRMLAERDGGKELDLEDGFAIPETIHGAVANRIDMLPRGEQQVLHAAAVLGQTVWRGAVAAMLQLPESDVDRSLRELQRRDMLVASTASSLAAETEFAFRHLLLREVAYGRLPRVTRATLHRRAADWVERVAMAGRNDTAASVAHHRVAALSLAQSLVEDTSADAQAARRALKAAADAAFNVYAVGPALRYVEQTLTLWPREEDPDERRDYELLRCRLAFLADSDRFYRDGGAKELTSLVERMRQAGDRTGEARAETLLGLVEVMRAERQPALEHLRRAVELFDALPDDATKTEAYGELARLHMVEYETVQALPAADKARTLAVSLGLPDAAANAMVTQSMARYISGDRAAIGQLRQAVALCREQRLPALRRAAANLAVVLQEEGDLAGAARMEAESVTALGAQVSPVFRHSEEAEIAWFTGDWLTLMRAADEYLDGDDGDTGEWDLQLRGRRTCLRILSDQPPGEDLARCLEAARHCGFPRLMFAALANGALAEALSGAGDTATSMLVELAEVWRHAPTALTMEWLSAAVHASALVGAGPAAVGIAAQTLTKVVKTVPIRTRWVEAADAVVAGARASAQADPGRAARAFARAVERYDAIGSTSDAVLTAAWAARALRSGGIADAAEPYEARVRSFATRNRAPGLVALLA